jgi:F-type H+-transporting ATPase subunit gamma
MAAGSSLDIKRRIRSVTSTQKITKALQTVSAVKMRKAQARAIAGRPFAEDALFLLRRLSGLPSSKHPLLAKKQTGKQLLVLITPDKGLTGGLLSNLSRKVQDLVEEQKKVKNRVTEIRAIGSKAEDFVKRQGYTLVGTSKADVLDLALARKLKNEIIDAYVDGPYDKIILGYTQFVSTLRQRPFIRGILPLTVEKIIDVEELPPALAEKPAEFQTSTYDLEPSPSVVLSELIPELVTMLLYHALLEAQASEHSARMIAMKNAFDNATELHEELTQTFNRVRQESITAALAEISAGVAALEKV